MDLGSKRWSQHRTIQIEQFLDWEGVEVMGKHGENIRKRKDGRWEARMICGYDLNGKAKYRSLYGKTYPEVKEKKNQYIRSNPTPLNNEYKENQKLLKITVAQVMKEWLAYKKDFVKESTFAHYTNLLEKHILPELGGIYLSALTSDKIDTFLKKKLCSGRLDGSGGLSSKTVADIRSILLLGLMYANRQNYLCAVNSKPFYPKTRQPIVKVMTREEQAKLERVLFEHPGPLELGILTALYGGLRIGEVCALQWGDFHFDNGTVQINKTMLRIQNVALDSQKKTKVLIDRPKTESSNRLVPIPSFLMAILKEHQMEQNVYLLTGTKTYMEPRVCLDKYKKVLKQAGLEEYNFHALRHTFATRCVESGFDTKSLSEILGHSNVNTTLQRYIHPSMDLKREQMERLEKISIQGQKYGQVDGKALIF